MWTSQQSQSVLTTQTITMNVDITIIVDDAMNNNECGYQQSQSLLTAQITTMNVHFTMCVDDANINNECGHHNNHNHC